jgi:hypothetical protein
MPAITSLPFVGTGWGRYWLETSLQYSSLTGAAITLPHFSSLDWNGCQIYGPNNKASTNVGVLIDGQETVRIFGHGGPSQFAIGVQAAGVGSGHMIRDTQARLCWFRGFLVNSTGYRVEDCQALKIGGTTHEGWQASHTFGFEFLGSGVVRRNVANDIMAVNETLEAVGFCTNNHVNPGVFDDNIAINPELRTKSIGFFFGSDNSRVVATRNTAVNQETGFFWKLPNTIGPSDGTPGAHRDNIAHNCTVPFLHGPLVEDLNT